MFGVELLVNSARLRPATLLKKRLWYRCFPVNFVKLLRKPFLQNTSRPLLLCFEHAQIFHISRVTWGIIWLFIIVESVNNALTSYNRLCNYVKLNSKEPTKMFNSALVIEKWLNISFSESKKNFCRLIKLWTPKICISTRFC